MKDETIPFYIPWITEQDKKAVSAALESRWLTGGPRVAVFEKVLARFIGTSNIVAVNSCTAALHLAMRALNIKPGDEVIVPVFTFAATANAAVFCGARPVFADIEEKTCNISPDEILNKISSKTKVIIPMHYAGQACDMKEITEIADDHGLSIVEDCAHSLGADYHNIKTGNFGVMGCFSFYPTKIITTLEGGAIATRDNKIAKRLRLLREHGMTKTAVNRETDATWFYDVAELGYNYRLTDPQAALGISQMKRIDKGIERRINAAHYLTAQIKTRLGDQISTPNEAPDRTHIYHLYTVRISEEKTSVNRNQVFKELARNGVGTSLHYTPLHLLTYYKQFLKEKQRFPIAEAVYKEILSLPLFPTMTKKHINYLVAKLQCVIEGAH